MQARRAQYRYDAPRLPLVITDNYNIYDVLSGPSYLLFVVIISQDMQWQVSFSDKGNTTTLESDSVGCEVQFITSK